MKKIIPLATATLILGIPLTAFSCSFSEKWTPTKEFVNKFQDYTTYNTWLDDQYDLPDVEKRFLDDSISRGSEKAYNFGSNIKSPLLNEITGTITPSDYTIKELEKTFSGSSFKQAVEVHNFIRNYSKWSESNVLGYTSNNISVNPKINAAQIDKKIIIDSRGGPTGNLDYTKEGKYFETLTRALHILQNPAKKQAKTVFLKANIAFFNQSQLGFSPSKFVNGLSVADKTELLSSIKTSKKLKYFENALNKGTVNDFIALKLMIGNVDLPLSKTLEVFSNSFAEIDAIKKLKLIEHFRSEHYKVILEGTSYGYTETISDILYKPEILKKSFSVAVGLNFLNKSLLYSSRATGGIMIPAWEKTFIGNPGTVNHLIFTMMKYTKMKYGFIGRLSKMFKNAGVKNDFVNKVSIFLGGSDFNVGVISDYEKDFLDSNKINYKITMDKGHTLESFPNADFWSKYVYKEKSGTTIEPTFIYKTV